MKFVTIVRKQGDNEGALDTAPFVINYLRILILSLLLCVSLFLVVSMELLSLQVLLQEM